MAARDESEILDEGCRKLGLELPPGALEKLSAYLDLLEKWNRAYNLTAVRRREDMVVRHLLDSLAILPCLRGQRFLDVGSGAGLPGVPLAICLPDAQFVLLDSNGKKTRFLFQVRHALALANLQIVADRVENYTPEEPFDGLLCRAFASLPDILTLCGHLLPPAASLYAMKGPCARDELLDLQAGGVQARLEVLDVPYLEEPRSLLIIEASRCAEEAEKRAVSHMQGRG